MIRFVRDTVVAVGLVPLVITVAMFARTVWRLRSSRERVGPRAIGTPAVVFGVALLLNALLLSAFVRPLYRSLDASGYVAALKELKEAAGPHGDLKKTVELARIAVAEFPSSGELSVLGTELLLRAGDCDGLRRHLVKNPAALSSQEVTHRNLVTLARAALVCDLPVRENPDASRLIDSLRNRLDKREEIDLLQMVMGLDTGLGADFSLYGRAMPAETKIREDTLIEAVTTHVGDKGRTELTIYFRPLSDWKGRRLWVHAYPPASTEYVDVSGEFPPFNGWRKDALAWEVFQTPDHRAFNIYIGVANGDDLGAALPLGVIGGT